MRGSLSYTDLMQNISVDDKEIMNTIIKENIELSVQAKMPLL